MMCEEYAKAEEKRQEKLKKEELKLIELEKHLYNEVSEEAQKFVTETVLGHSRYLFVDKKPEKVIKYKIVNFECKKFKMKEYECYCTHCKNTYTACDEEIKLRYKHNEIVECPHCGSKVKVKYTRYGRSKLIDSGIFITYRNSKIDKNVLLAEGYYVYRDYRGNYKEVETQYTELNKYVFMQGEAYILKKDWWDKEYHLKEGYVNFKDGYNNYRAYVDEESLYKYTDNTFLRYTGYKNIKRNDRADLTMQFYQYSRYPVIEHLEKLGFDCIANCMLNGYSLEKSVNWKRKDNVFKFLGLNKGEVKEIKSQFKEITPGILKVFKMNKKQKLKLSVKEIEEISKKLRFLDNKYLKYTNIKKLHKYLLKQLELIDHDRFVREGTIMREWQDYLDMYVDNFLEKGEILTDRIMYPKDIRKAHINIIKKIKIKNSKELDVKIKKLIKKNSKYEYEYKDLIVKIPRTIKDIEIEGKILNHCVYANYSKPYAEGNTVILFIRHKDRPEIPFCTMEVKQNLIKQCYGVNDTQAPEEVKEMLEHYKVDILKKKNKKVA